MTDYKTARGYLKPTERKYLYNIARTANTIINIGVEYGCSLYCFHQGNLQADIIAIDLNYERFEGDVGYTFGIPEIVLRDDMLQSILDSDDQQQIVFVKGNSQTIPITVQAEVIFVDGDHSYKGVTNDIEKYAPLCTNHLLFHDYSDIRQHAGVKRAVDEWEVQTTEFKRIAQIETIAVFKRTINNEQR